MLCALHRRLVGTCPARLLIPFMHVSSKALCGLPGAAPVHKPTGAEHLMAGTEPRPNSTRLQNLKRLPLWIIEYVWAHKTMDIQQVVDPSNWPEVDSQPLSLKDSWRLRVASAEVYSIVKNRDVERFERVMSFLEATYRLLPRLVAPIKHMKIMFGLKTMVIMRMLGEGRGIVDTVLKTSQFFPRRLPQYQGQCSQHAMFLMRKNHLDFKVLAQALAMDKDKLEDYIKTQMEEQYGEHYAQKVEDRLLHYLQEVETALPGDTYIDTILKKESPVTEEEKLLLEVIASDSAHIATTLKNLLHCDAASCRPGSVSESSAHRRSGLESSPLSTALLDSKEAPAPLQLQPKAFRGGMEAEHDEPKGRLLLLEKDDVSDVSRPLKTEEDVEVVRRSEGDSSDEETRGISPRSRGGVKEAPPSPQFCCKHQRWVRSILQECPDECSEELLLLQANVSSSPPLFQSSSSTTSSQDLTPSGIVPCPPDQRHPPSQTSTHLQTAVQASEQGNPEDQQRSGSPGLASDGSQTEPVPRPSSSRGTRPPILWSPVVRLIDIASVGGSYPIFKPHRAPLDDSTALSNRQVASAPRPQVLTSPPRQTPGSNATPLGAMEDTTIDPPEAPLSQGGSASCQPPTQRSFSKLSRKFRRACAPTRPSPALGGFSPTPLPEQFMKAPTTFCSPSPDYHVSGPPTEDASTSTPQGAQPPRESKTRGHRRPAVRSETSRVRRAKLKLLRPSPALLLESELLQPYVSLYRLSAQECSGATEPRSSTSGVEAVLRASNDDDEEEDADLSFDVNALYSGDSSSSDSEDTFQCDPEYKPRFRKKRLLHILI